MKIKINYTLYTDGDYNLKNAEEFGCVTNRHEYNYIGFMEFKDKEAWRCKHKAKSFFGDFYVMEFMYLIHILGCLKIFMTL